MTEPLTLAGLASRPLWVAWQTEDRLPGKPTKVPYNPRGGKAKADKPATWGVRPDAELRAAKLPKPYGLGGVGIEFCPLGDGRSLAGIDLDICRDATTGNLESWAEDVIATFDSYVEVSPSNTGAKVFFLYETAALQTLRPLMGEALYGRQFKRGGGEHPPAIELHLGNRFFATTDKLLIGSRPDLREIEAGTIAHLLQATGPAFVGKPQAAAGQAKASKAKAAPGGSTDRSRSSAAFRVGKEAVAAGYDFDRMCKAIQDTAETADWYREKGTANGGRELRRIFDKAKAAGPVIQMEAGELHKTATAGEAALIAAGLPIYQRGHFLVRPVMQEVPAAKGRMTLAASLVEVSLPNMVDMLCGAARWERFDARSEEWARTNPPKQVAETILARVGVWTFPKVIGVITTPTIRPDGSILSEPGYDAATRLYHAADPTLRLHQMAHRTTEAAAKHGLSLLRKLLGEFPFVDGRESISEAVALSALITPVVRGALPVVPMHAFRANTAGSGKSYLADVSSAISSGRLCPVTTAGQDEAETEKRLVGLLLAGFPLVSLDNVNSELGGDLLCQAIERPLVRLRPLGRSETVEVESRATVFGNGNGLRVRGDMTRRTLISDLDAEQERPELREFKADPVATVLQDRGLYVSACLAIVRAYAAAGRPGRLPPLASFSEWSDTVRSALVWLGCKDPAASMETAREDDPELSELREIVEVWKECLPLNTPMTCSAIVAHSEMRPEQTYNEPSPDYSWPTLRELLHRLAGNKVGVDTTRLGKCIRKYEKRIVGGHRLEREKVTTAVAQWKLVAVKRGCSE